MGTGAEADSVPGEVAAGRAAVFAAVVMIAQQIAGKATRDALFLSLFPASKLPQVMLVAAGMSLLAVLGMSQLLAKRGPARVIPLCFALSGGLFAGEWALAGTQAEIAAWAVYLHTTVFGAIAISGFWSVVGERFDPQTAKTQVARAATGATLGGVLGGLGAERLAGVLSLRGMLLVLAALNVVCAAGVFMIGKPDKAPPTAHEQRSGLQIMRETPYLQLLGAIVGLVAVAATLLEYVFKAEAANQLGDGAALMQFFAIFYAAAALLTFAVQGALGKRLLAKLGLNGTIALLPAAVVLFSGLAAAWVRLWTVTLLRAAENILQNSLFRSGYEILYTPLPPAQKRPTKIAIDVAFKRAGGALGSGAVIAVLWLQPERATMVVLLLALAIGALALLVVQGLHSGYVGALAESLRMGVVELAEEDVIDATTRRTLTETTRALDRERLLKEIAQLRTEQAAAERASSRGAKEAPPSRRGTLSARGILSRRDASLSRKAAASSQAGKDSQADKDSQAGQSMTRPLPHDAAGPPSDSETDDTLVSAALRRKALEQAARSSSSNRPANPQAADDTTQAITSGHETTTHRQASGAIPASTPRTLRNPDSAAAAATLLDDVRLISEGRSDAIKARLQQGITPQLVAHVLPLLKRRRTERDATRALAAVAPQVVGQLVDALLDPERDVTIRRRVARLLGSCEDPRAITGLQLGLHDELAEIRHPCGEALASLRKRMPEQTQLPPEQVYALIEAELAEQPQDLSEHNERDEMPNAPEQQWLADARARQREHTRDHLFALLTMAHDPEPLLLAKRALSADRMMRGTALEYLDAVLPAEVRAGMWPFLGAVEPPSPARRSREQLRDDLLSSADAMALDRAALGLPDNSQ